jgi:hypothetical protein
MVPTPNFLLTEVHMLTHAKLSIGSLMRYGGKL